MNAAEYPASVQPLVDAILQGDEEAAEKAVQVVLQAVEACPEDVLPLLGSAHSDLRWWAARTLGECYHPRALEALLGALADPAAEVRQCAALGLRHHALHGLDAGTSRRVVSALLPLLCGGDTLLRSLVRQALGAIGAPALPALLDVLDKGSPAARLSAMRALAEIGDQRAIPAMFQAVSGEDSALIQYWAEQGLEKMGVGMVFFRPQ